MQLFRNVVQSILQDTICLGILFYYLIERSAVDAIVPARGKAIIPTDISIAIPVGTYARIAPRSGLAAKFFIDVGAGVIDYDYRGSVGVVLFNFNESNFEVKKGDRIAQLILEVIVNPPVIEVESLDETKRGEGGFGSTGGVQAMKKSKEEQ